jgi:hypothetical protein
MKKHAESSYLMTFGFDERKNLLEIEFTDGSVYRYIDVSSNIYQGLMNSQSHGRYYLAHIKNNFQNSKSRAKRFATDEDEILANAAREGMEAYENLYNDHGQWIDEGIWDSYLYD